MMIELHEEGTEASCGLGGVAVPFSFKRTKFNGRLPFPAVNLNATLNK